MQAMQYRQLGRTGLRAGVIGLGTEHLERSSENMDEVLDTAVAAGLNYVDLVLIDPSGSDARFWECFGPALRRHREGLILAAHWGSGPRWEVDYCRRCFDEVLAQGGNGYAEIGLLTMVDDEGKWDGWAQESIELLHRYQEQGRVGHIGLSTHETAIAWRAVDSGWIDVLMFGVNLIGHGDEEKQALYQTCAEKGVGLVAMKPYFGGTLLCVDGRPTTITPVQCLAYVLSLPVAVALPGPRNAAELRAALYYSEATAEEKDFRLALEGVYHDLAGHCVYCNHCLPCPQGIPIGFVILLVDWAQGGITDELRAGYAGLSAGGADCVECGECLERCPFGVDVVGKMRRAVELFAR